MEGRVDNNRLQTETEQEPFLKPLHLTSIHLMIMSCYYLPKNSYYKLKVYYKFN